MLSLSRKQLPVEWICSKFIVLLGVTIMRRRRTNSVSHSRLLRSLLPATLLLLPLSGGLLRAAEGPRPHARTNAEGWYEWAFPLDDPALEEIDLSFLLDPPAGRRGFLTVSDEGHFVFEDGTRARFFGTNVGGPSAAPDKRIAEFTAARLARFGVNLVRLHAPDSRWAGLIDYGRGDTRALDPETLDRYDYFVAQLKEHGIYVYFDLLCYRNFQPGDGVRDAEEMDTRWEHSMKGASIFDRRMIELQKEYATQLLTHRNPYTGLRYVDEPALAVQEITNENSLFYLHNQKLMLPSYVEDLRGLWNAWLLGRYGDREGLAGAWTNAAGQCALLPDEDPAEGTVQLPTQHLYADLRDAPYVGERSPPRLAALSRFLHEQQVAYFDEMIAHLREIGLRIPITGTNQDFCNSGNLANARGDFMARNNYWHHPNVNVRPMRFNHAAMVNADILRAPTLMASVASSAVAGKPLISPEFNSPWPNEWRAEALPMMAAYGRLQDWDGLLFFAYHPDRPTREVLTSFGTQSDPVHWGQIPLAALIFHRGDVAVARNTVHVGISAGDLFATRPQRGRDRYSPYRMLPYLSKVRNAYFDDRYEGEADVVIASGHSAAGDYSAARRAIVFADWPFIDAAATAADRGHSARQIFPGLRTEPAADRFDTRLLRDTIPAGSRVIERDGAAVGFYDERFCIFPAATADEEEDPAWLHRLYLQMADHWGLPGAAPVEEAGDVFRSDTGELVLDRQQGLFTVVADHVAVAAGQLDTAGEIGLGPVTVTCQTPFASLSVVSLDGEPLDRSRRLLLTAVARSLNTGQRDAPVNPGAAREVEGVDADTGMPLRIGRFALEERGEMPVLAEPVDAEVRIATAAALRAYPLGPRGERREALPLVREDEGVRIGTLRSRSPWVLLVAE